MPASSNEGGVAAPEDASAPSPDRPSDDAGGPPPSEATPSDPVASGCALALPRTHASHEGGTTSVLVGLALLVLSRRRASPRLDPHRARPRAS
jgi:hypothetical protein